MIPNSALTPPADYQPSNYLFASVVHPSGALLKSRKLGTEKYSTFTNTKELRHYGID